MEFFSLHKKKSPGHFIPLTTDIHSHLIPGIDDGAQTEEESLHLIEGLYNLGYRKLITTPHIYHSRFNNSPEIIKEGVQKLQATCDSRGFNITLQAAAEYFFDNYFFEYIENRSLLTFGKHYVLFELPMNILPAIIDEIADNLRNHGYTPVLAHPERYTYLHDKKMAAYKKLKDQGILLQLNIMSLTGYYNAAVKHAAQNLVKYGMIDFAGSDIHRQKHIAVLRFAQQDQSYKDLLASGQLLNNLI
ncbi:MAG: capsular biosynthesis protein [Chitinophagales bacterium]|nr:capsular biosynthesis protein [Chitinophagales bacterium]